MSWVIDVTGVQPTKSQLHRAVVVAVLRVSCNLDVADISVARSF